MRKVRITTEAGFTLIEMLIVALLVGVLKAIAAPVYFGYTKDAKASEAKSVVGSLWTALQGCAQASPGTPCTVSGQYARAALTAAGVTADARWTAAAGDAANTVTMVVATNKYSVGGAVPLLQFDGTATDNTGLSVQFTWTDATAIGTFQCSADGGANYSAC